jgi:[ribosomal protein S5]-alanine N-acetyltransferase
MNIIGPFMNNKIELNDIPAIDTERLLLRRLMPGDAPAVFAYAKLPEVSEYLLWSPHQSEEESLEFIKFAEGQFSGSLSIIWGIEIKSENKIIGTIDLRNYKSVNSCGETGYGISSRYWNRGYVTEALKALIEFGFGVLALNRIEAHCEEGNIGSWRVMEKSGMKFEGIMREKIFLKGSFRSVKLYSILKSEFSQ